MNILIAGGAGFIGGNFVHYMLKAHPDYNITVLDKLTYAGHLQTLSSVISDIEFVKADIVDRNAVDSVFSRTKLDIVVNLAAESHVDRSIAEPEIFVATNIIGTQTLMDACCRYGVKRFHQVSTDEVYGDLPIENSDMLFTEASPIRPGSPYSASKAGADLLAMAYRRTYDLPVTISRCSNNYGPYQFPEKLIPLVITRAAADKSVPVYGNGLNVRDWIHTADHCRAIDLILQNGTVGEVYNIGGHNEMANIDIVRKILTVLGKSESLIEYVPDRKGHDLRYGVDTSKLCRELGWQAEVEFNKGLADTVRWYLENDWVREIGK